MPTETEREAMPGPEIMPALKPRELKLSALPAMAIPPRLRIPYLRNRSWRHAGPFFLFVLVLVFTIFSSFSKRVLGMALVFDSAMYLHSSVCVLNYMKTLFTFHMPSADAYKLLVEGVLLDGPVLPILGGTFFALLGLAPSTKDVNAALFLQAILQASAALLVYKITLDLTRKRAPALIAGYAWGFYPAAILGAGKFMTEILSTCLILSLVLAVSRIKKARRAFVAGTLIGLIALTKAALAPAAGIVVIFGFAYLLINRMPWRLIFKSALATICGVVLILGPWVIFTHKITGKMMITTNRQPTHNLVSGVNPENDGWASLPETPLGAMFTEEDPPLPSAVGIALPEASYELQLMARKIVRLFAQPWNDYRLNCLLVPLFAQIGWHKMILAFGLFGIIALLMDIARKDIERTKEMHAQKIELIFCLLVILLIGHFIYLPFVACSRYGFTAMPILTIFAVLGLSRLLGLGKQFWSALAALAFAIFAFEFNIVKFLQGQVINNQNIDVLFWATVFKIALCLTGVLLLTRILRRHTGFKTLPWSINGFLGVFLTVLLCTISVDTYCEPMNGELIFKFSNSRPLHRSCVLSEKEVKNPHLKAAYLLLDSRTKTTILGRMNVNGQLQSLFLAPFYLVHPEANIEGCYEMFAKLRFQRGAELNQWYLAEIPTSMLRAGKNDITVTPEPKYVLSVNGSPKSRYLQGNYVSLPSLTYFSPTLLMNDLDGYDARPRQTVYICSGKDKRIEGSLDRNFDADYERTSLNALVLLVYEKAASETQAQPPALTNIFPQKINLYQFVVAPH
jgi:hypothetical protein